MHFRTIYSVSRLTTLNETGKTIGIHGQSNYQSTINYSFYLHYLRSSLSTDLLSTDHRLLAATISH